MKKLKWILAGLMSIALLLPTVAMAQSDALISADVEMRGLWVATVYNIDYPSKATTDPATLKSEAIAVLDKAQAAGLNAVFLQVRPTADAFYSSKIFPWSKYLTGTQGLAPQGGFDPLVFWVDEAHKRGMELHAWINPYRITKKGSKDPDHDFASLAATNPAKLHPEWVIKHTDGNLYFDPGIPEVRKLIVDSVLELIQNYDIDGIHFDDYFYPGQTFADSATYKNYGKGFANINDWRRENVNILIKDLSTVIRNSGKHIDFGISPFGIWANKKTNALGSDTNGMQSYYDHYADTRKWVKDGTLDYIAPQIYWNIGYSIADYAKLLTWWKDVVQGTSVKLYVGHAAYRVGNADSASPWYGVSEIGRQLTLNQSTGGVAGSIFYNYSAFRKYPELGALISNFYQTNSGQGQSTVTPQTGITFARPTGDMQTNLNNYFVFGASDPNYPLYVNGVLVEGRSSKGYFGYYAPLSVGQNKFVFSQGTSTKTLTITKGTTVTQAAPMKTIEIPSASVFPQNIEQRQPGEKITLACKAPIGSTVTVKINGQSYTMKPAVSKTTAKAAYATTYSYVYTLPNFTGTPRNVSLGKPVYTMKYNGKSSSRTAPSEVGVILPGSPYYAKVLDAVIDTYKTPTTSNGAAAELYQGMLDKVTGVTGNYVRLASGLWVKKDKAGIFKDSGAFKGSMKSAYYQVGTTWDGVYFELSHTAVAVPSFHGKVLKLEFSGVENMVPLELPEASLFASVTAQVTGEKAVYTLTLKEGETLEGFSIHTAQNVIILDLKRKPQLAVQGLPLNGITVLLDPGHGGSDPGAIGPLGTAYAEKHINLNIALKLRDALKALGATVEMTRTADVEVSLTNRLAFSRQLKPDLFISIHANSMDSSADINKISGLGVYYKESMAKEVSQQILDGAVLDLGRNNRGINVNNFYVVRGTWAPSLLIETGFVPNPIEFEWLTDDGQQSVLAGKIAESVLKYFAQ